MITEIKADLQVSRLVAEPDDPASRVFTRPQNDSRALIEKNYLIYYKCSYFRNYILLLPCCFLVILYKKIIVATAYMIIAINIIIALIKKWFF